MAQPARRKKCLVNESNRCIKKQRLECSKLAQHLPMRRLDVLIASKASPISRAAITLRRNVAPALKTVTLEEKKSQSATTNEKK